MRIHRNKLNTTKHHYSAYYKFHILRYLFIFRLNINLNYREDKFNIFDLFRQNISLKYKRNTFLQGRRNILYLKDRVHNRGNIKLHIMFNSMDSCLFCNNLVKHNHLYKSRKYLKNYILYNHKCKLVCIET